MIVNWTGKRPTKPGWYWYKDCSGYTSGKNRLVHVWKCAHIKDDRLFTNEDGAAPITDRIYDGGLWSSEPMKEPEN